MASEVPAKRATSVAGIEAESAHEIPECLRAALPATWSAGSGSGPTQSHASCGDGRSFEHYPTSVTQLVAVEPDPTARAVAAERARATAVPIDVVNGTAEALPAEDGSFDAVVSMGVLCTVSDPAATLAEARRVLDPTGELRFWEHSARASCRCACSNGHWTCSSGRARWLAAVRRATPRRRSPHPGSSSSPSIAASTHHRR
jgi:SAM-dependent methyltransferase